MTKTSSVSTPVPLVADAFEVCGSGVQIEASHFVLTLTPGVQIRHISTGECTADGKHVHVCMFPATTIVGCTSWFEEEETKLADGSNRRMRIITHNGIEGAGQHEIRIPYTSVNPESLSICIVIQGRVGPVGPWTAMCSVMTTAATINPSPST
jgi:hypothetical protein